MRPRTVILTTLAVLIPLGVLFALAKSSFAQNTDWLPWLGLLADILGKWSWTDVLLVITGFFVLSLGIFWQLNPGDGFDWRGLVADRSVNQHAHVTWTVRPGKTFQTGCFLFSSWFFIKNGVNEKPFPEWFIALYFISWAGSTALNQWAASRFPTSQRDRDREDCNPRENDPREREDGGIK